ncbi:MAG: hypothetical protein RBR47_13155 [Bacteroidales bacterium]|jgi:hypothetical protein|nr:hypothetical protein [Bacteroidales bacterium]MDD3527096.1 hypothetical protein [Bacteroidales bacterium]MDD4742455.1 hypothetical protein [Bacteroidales bacterium]MDY0335896.1 hypothetical protein [Bacteroidales bacterium]
MFFPDKILFTFVELKNGILESEKFRYFYKKRRLKLDPEEKKPFSTAEFNERIEKSMDDSRNGRLTENKELLAEVKKWQ